MVAELDKQEGQGLTLRFVEYGLEITATQKRQDGKVVHHTNKVDERWHNASENHHLRSEVSVHPREQPVKGECKKDQYDRADQVGEDAQAEKQLVRGDIVDGRRGVPVHEQFVGNVH